MAATMIPNQKPENIHLEEKKKKMENMKIGSLLKMRGDENKREREREFTCSLGIDGSKEKNRMRKLC